MAARLVAGAVGALFGLTLCWTGMSSPEVIRAALLFQSSYLFLMFGSAVAVAFVGLRLLKAARVRAPITGDPVRWSAERPLRRHIAGSAIFGVGWAIADACPGPVATQLGQGVAWSLFTLGGIAIGIDLHVRRGRAASSGRARAATPRVEPAGEHA